MSPKAHAATGLTLALAGAGCYGLNIVFARLAADEGITGAALALYRVLPALAIVAVAAIILRHPLSVAPRERGAVAILGLSSAVIGTAYLSSVAFIPVTVAVVIFFTFPILIVLASPFVEGRRLTAPLLVVAATAFVGVSCVVGPGLGAYDIRGLALAALASLAATAQFFAGVRCRRTGITAKVFWVHVLVLPAAASIGFATASLNPPGDLLLAPLAVALTIAGYVLGFILQIAALARASAVMIGLAFCAEPVVAAVSAAAVLGEELGGLQILGGGLVIAAIAANVVLEHRRPVAAGPRPDRTCDALP